MPHFPSAYSYNLDVVLDNKQYGYFLVMLRTDDHVGIP